MNTEGTRAEALIAGAPLHAPIAWRAGQPIDRAQFLADVATLGERLPEAGHLLALTDDRYRFAVALGAAVLRRQCHLLPPNHTAETVKRLRELHSDAYALVERGSPQLDLPAHPFGELRATAMPARTRLPQVDAAQLVAQVFTSGSTGAPTRHDKHWGLLTVNAHAEAQRLAATMQRPDLQGVTLVGTVPHHHMYGFESTVLLALREGAAFACERPFFAADIVAVLEQVPRPRVLVTTPFHLKTLLDSGLAVPPVDMVLSATAPLSPQMAARAEQMLGAPLIEIYGCTEAGQVATRRPTEGPEWLAFDGLVLSGDGDMSVVQGGHVPEPVRLSDVLEVLSPTRFRLLGRSNDLINVAGKRSSLSHLNHHLNSIAGVHDGAFWLPPSATVEGISRLVAFVVAPTLSRDELIAQLRPRVDPAMLPRRIVHLDRLPRDATGKLPAARLADLARQHLGTQPD